MTQSIPPVGPTHAVNDIRRSLAATENEKLKRVVAVLDTMEVRGSADHVLNAIRPRLHQLRLPRPLRFARLLFMPLDTLIVNVSKWKQSDPTVPRTTLVAIAHTVRAGLGSRATEIGALISGCTTDNTACVEQAGAMLWPAAAEILAARPAPVGWRETGMPVSIFHALAPAIAMVLQRLPALRDLAARCRDGVLEPNFEMLQGVCEGFETLPSTVQVMVMTLAMNEIPDFTRLLDSTASQRGKPSLLLRACDQARERHLMRLSAPGGIEGAVVTGHLSMVASQVRRIAGLLAEMQASYQLKEQRAAVQALFGRLDACCQNRFAEDMTGQFLTPLRYVLATGDCAAQPQLESAIRQLRNLETEARSFGGGPVYDRLLRAAADNIVTNCRGVMGTTQRVRLIELLVGSDEAAALWESETDGAES